MALYIRQQSAAPEAKKGPFWKASVWISTHSISKVQTKKKKKIIDSSDILANVLIEKHFKQW